LNIQKHPVRTLEANTTVLPLLKLGAAAGKEQRDKCEK